MGELDWLVPVTGLLIALYFAIKSLRIESLDDKEWYEYYNAKSRNRKSDCTPKKEEEKPMVKDLILFTVRELQQFPLSDSDKSGIEVHLKISEITGDYKECYSYVECLKEKYSKASPAGHSLPIDVEREKLNTLPKKKDWFKVDMTKERQRTTPSFIIRENESFFISGTTYDNLLSKDHEESIAQLSELVSNAEPKLLAYYKEENAFYYGAEGSRGTVKLQLPDSLVTMPSRISRKELVIAISWLNPTLDFANSYYDKLTHTYYIYDKQEALHLQPEFSYEQRNANFSNQKDSVDEFTHTHTYGKSNSLNRIHEEVSAEVDKTFQPLMSKLYSLAGLPEDYSVSTSTLNANSITASTLDASFFNPEDSYFSYLQKSPYRSFSLDDNSIHKPAHTIKKKVVAREWFIGIKETEEEQKLRYLIQEEKILGWDYF